MTDYNPLAVSGHNSDGADEASAQAAKVKSELFESIDSLYEEAGHWADGTDIESQEQHDAVTLIRETIHDLGKKADDLRKAEKAPYDKMVDAVQAEFNPYVQAKKGKVDKAKSCLDAVLGRWRVKEQKRKDEIARREREEADEELRQAQNAIRASTGNLAARDEAEQALERAKETQTFARRAERDATARTGLRTVRRIELPEESRSAGMDWAFDHDPESFFRLAVDMAAEYYRITKRTPPGFVVIEDKVAR